MQKWGGVVPELAARYHAEKLPLMFSEMLKKNSLNMDDINYIGVTNAPGLIGPLLTGLSFAKTLSLLNEIPILGVNHLFAHLEAIFLSHSEDEVTYPYLGCLFSGGHSLFVLVTSSFNWEFLGSTIDDAAGEAFDKGGKLLGIPYPSGRIIDELSVYGDPTKIQFPRPMASKEYGMKMSFSGLKNSFRLKVEESKLDISTFPEHWWKTRQSGENWQFIYDLFASYQNAITKSLVEKMQLAHESACKNFNIDTKSLPVVFGGGVACNSSLRAKVIDWAAKKNVKSFFVEPKYCTDNGAMIANWTYRNLHRCTPFPECLAIDAHSSILNKMKDHFV